MFLNVATFIYGMRSGHRRHNAPCACPLCIRYHRTSGNPSVFYSIVSFPDRASSIQRNLLDYGPDQCVIIPIQPVQ